MTHWEKQAWLDLAACVAGSGNLRTLSQLWGGVSCVASNIQSHSRCKAHQSIPVLPTSPPPPSPHQAAAPCCLLLNSATSSWQQPLVRCPTQCSCLLHAASLQLPPSHH